MNTPKFFVVATIVLGMFIMTVHDGAFRDGLIGLDLACLGCAGYAYWKGIRK